jgi:hypothetical protein
LQAVDRWTCADTWIGFSTREWSKENVSWQLTQGDEVRITGSIPAKVSDFKIDPPSLFTVAIKNDMPVRVEMTGKKDK